MLRLLPADLDDDSVALLRLARATTLAEQAELEPRLRLAAFDALDAVVRLAPTQQKTLERYAIMVDGLLRTQSYLRPLAPLAWAHLPTNLRKEVLELPAALPAMLHQHIHEPTRVWFEQMGPVTELAINVENARLELMPPLDLYAARAAWGNFAIEIPALTRSVPRGKSITESAEYEELLLVLIHELTHLQCMPSYLGAIATALRLAAMNVEIVMWSLSGGLQEKVFDEHGGLAPLPDQPLTIFQVERSLDILRKIQIFENLLTPWFEGVAVFAELADPAQDADAGTEILERFEAPERAWEGIARNMLALYLGAGRGAQLPDELARFRRSPPSFTAFLEALVTTALDVTGSSRLDELAASLDGLGMPALFTKTGLGWDVTAFPTEEAWKQLSS